MNPTNRRISNFGQATLEFSIGTILVVLPICFGVATWYKTEWNRVECAHKTFIKARNELLITHSTVYRQEKCGQAIETVQLQPLESLSENSGGLNLESYVKTASRYSELLSHLPQRLSDLDSSKLWEAFETELESKTILIDAPDDSH